MLNFQQHLANRMKEVMNFETAQTLSQNINNSEVSIQSSVMSPSKGLFRIGECTTDENDSNRVNKLESEVESLRTEIRRLKRSDQLKARISASPIKRAQRKANTSPRPPPYPNAGSKVALSGEDFSLRRKKDNTYEKKETPLVNDISKLQQSIDSLCKDDLRKSLDTCCKKLFSLGAICHLQAENIKKLQSELEEKTRENFNDSDNENNSGIINVDIYNNENTNDMKDVLRDNYFYSEQNKELKRQMRVTLRKLENKNTELSNLKTFLEQTSRLGHRDDYEIPPVYPVVVSMNHLREIESPLKQRRNQQRFSNESL